MNNLMNPNLRRGSEDARRVPARWRFALPAASLACALVSGSALAQEAPLDPDIQFIVDNGFETFLFAQTCRSVGPDGDVIDVEPLPVGGGRTLECETEAFGQLQAIDALSSTDEPFCVLGQVSSFTGENVDPRLSVSVVSAPDGAPWVLSATSEEEITISRVGGPAGGTAFPLAADILLDVVEVQPNPAGQLCSDLFGL